MKRVTIGIERLSGELSTKVKGRRAGLVAHPASTDASLVHALDLLVNAGVKVTSLFGPEHGFGGQAQDMEPVEGLSKGPGGLPIHSLYGSDETSLSPRMELLDELDMLIVDLFDVGSRYYTFVWTATLCLRACQRAGIEMVLTDRPNPLGGEIVEGSPQDPGFLSFVGLAPVSNRHGLTPGELVRLAAEEEGTADTLTIVPMKGWQRSMLFEDTGLPFVMPSPNMPTLDTAFVYPGLCLIEATWASEGRGTTKPFELVGAPGIDGARLAARLENMRLPGVRFRPVSFRPGFQKHAGYTCSGVQIHVTSARDFLPYRTGVACLLALKAEAKDRFAWRHEPYEFVTDRPAVDLLTGSETVRKAVDQGADIEEVAATWAEGEADFRERKTDFHLY